MPSKKTARKASKPAKKKGNKPPKSVTLLAALEIVTDSHVRHFVFELTPLLFRRLLRERQIVKEVAKRLKLSLCGIEIFDLCGEWGKLLTDSVNLDGGSWFIASPANDQFVPEPMELRTRLLTEDGVVFTARVRHSDNEVQTEVLPWEVIGQLARGNLDILEKLKPAEVEVEITDDAVFSNDGAAFGEALADVAGELANTPNDPEV